jgi:CheY-like chemotaxis protein
MKGGMVERDNAEKNMNAPVLAKARCQPLGWMRKLLTPACLAHRNTDSQATAIPESAITRQNKTVLVVDDDPVFLRATSLRLESSGYDVITATDASEAIRAVRKQKPHLLVLDVNLPLDVSGMSWDGFRVIAWLKHFDELKGIPVVMVTGGDPQKLTRQAFVAGARAFFHKRMEPGHLLTLVSHTLGRKPAAPQPALGTNFEI